MFGWMCAFFSCLLNLGCLFHMLQTFMRMGFVEPRYMIFEYNELCKDTQSIVRLKKRILFRFIFYISCGKLLSGMRTACVCMHDAYKKAGTNMVELVTSFIDSAYLINTHVLSLLVCTMLLYSFLPSLQVW